jgi:hypothetical protein
MDGNLGSLIFKFDINSLDSYKIIPVVTSGGMVISLKILDF